MKTVIVLAFIFLLLPFVAGELLVSQPDSIYNFGDQLNLYATIKPIADTTGFLTVKLFCPNGNVELYRNPMTTKASQVYNVTISTELSKGVVDDLEGTCYFSLNYGSDNTESQRFELSRSLNVQLEIQGSPANPGEKILLEGSAQKANGDVVNGYIEIFVGANNVSYDGILSNGSFSQEINLPENLAAGEQTVRLHAFEEDSNGDVTNEGESSYDIIVKVIVKTVDVQLAEDEFDPNKSLVFTVKASDQTGNPLDRDASYVIYKPDGNVFLQAIGKTNVEQNVFLEGKSTPGYWKVESKVGESSIKRLFYIHEVKRASFNLANKTLIVTNDGNIVYDKTVEISIGDHAELLDVKIPVGATKKFKLSAPDSVYNIKVSDGENRLEASTVALTGNAIGIGEIRGMSFGGIGVGIFVLILLCLVFVTNFYMKKRTLTMGSSPGMVEGVPVKKLPRVGIVDGGKKENASVIALRTDAGTTSSQEVVNNAVARARKAGAYVYEDGKNTLMVFSPGLTKKDNNELLAAQVAREISGAIDEHNKKIKDKIDFGLGIGKGEVLIENKATGKSVTSMGSLIPSTKRLASSSKEEVLMSDELYKTIMTSVKAEKASDRDAWKLKEIVNRDQHKGFIDSFLSREFRK